MDSQPSKEAPPPEPIPRRPSQDSQDAFGTDSDVDASSSDMDSVGEGYRRRRAQLMAGLENGHASGKGHRKHSRRKHRETAGTPNGEGKQMEYSSDESSEFSSRSTSDDVELSHLASDDALQDDEETGLTKKNKEHRKRRRRKATRLDGRIAGNIKTSKQEQKVADRNVLKAMIVNVALIASWYLFSLSISIYNKWMFDEKYLNFHFPLFTTCLHMLVQFCLATTVLYFIPRLRPRSDSITNPHNHFHVRRDVAQDEKPLMTRMFYLTRIGPCGAATGLDIGLGNMSLKFITLTFYTMCKSSSLAFVLMFAFLFRLESPSIKLILIIITMTVGVIMMVAGEAFFDAIGFILVIAAAFFSGFRWALTQILLLRNPATSNPFSSIFFLAPIMFLSLLIIAMPVEGPVRLAQGLVALAEAKGVFMSIVILVFPGMLAFLMTSSEFALLQRTSVVTLSICGIFKEVVTITAAGIVFHDPLTPINVSGLLVTIASIAAYNYIKIIKMRKDARKEVEVNQKLGEDADENGEAAAPMLSPRSGGRASTSLEIPHGRAKAAASAKSPHENE
ncbi:hypothetical protein OEA41_002319 [Lepraria neglecta]|uniref:Sugar phosphate transporter domain-containing protein n=1 Tax=Lepraria neglecta TaxID=209136 RepID=A0AAD9ZC92_9LECA|nr:hypothetical protein OEA41_002319 [Lepraria neglecta]